MLPILTGEIVCVELFARIIDSPRNRKTDGKFGYLFGGKVLIINTVYCTQALTSIRSINVVINLFSLGMSWISGRVARGTPWSAMLDSIKASILGLGGVDCAVLYPDCDLRKERVKRRRRRRK